MSDLILAFLKQYGFQALPTLLLGLLCWHHLRVLAEHKSAVKTKAASRAATFKEKDEEIHRLQEERLRQVELSSERSMEVAQNANALNMETSESLKAVAEQLENLQAWLPRPPRR